MSVHRQKTSWKHLANMGLVFLIVLSVLVAFISTYTEGESATLYFLEGAFVLKITVEYILRLWMTTFIHRHLSRNKHA